MGGPAIHEVKEGVYELAGLFSFFGLECQLPAIYSDVNGKIFVHFGWLLLTLGGLLKPSRS